MVDTSKIGPRLSIAIDIETQGRLQRLIPWGLQSHIFRVMVDGLLDVLEKSPEHRDIVIAAFMSKDISVLDLLKRVTLRETQKGDGS